MERTQTSAEENTPSPLNLDADREPITPEPLNLDAQTLSLELAEDPPASDVDFGLVEDCIERIRPYIQGDGGDLELVDVRGLTVYVRVYGACVSCGALDMTMTHGVQSMLREEVHPDLVVEQLL